MKLEFGLLQNQTLKINMSQQLAQAISLLQYTSMELANYVENMAQENPLLDVEMNVYTPIDFRGRKNRMTYKEANQVFAELQIPDLSTSIFDYLLEQILPRKLTKDEYTCFKFLVNHLNDDGYLEITVDEVSKTLKIPKHTGEEMLQMLHGLNPAGIGARNLQECIILQLKRKEEVQQEDLDMISSYFHELLQKDWKRIVQETNIPLYKIQHLFDLVKTLDPRPGAFFSNERTHYIVPDIFIEKSDDFWHIKVAEDSYIHIKVNERYYNELLSYSDSRITAYVQDKYQQIQWLQESIQQRKQTMMKIMQAIIELQESYFLGVEKELTPMTMKEIAGRVGVHESTVSRVVKNKFVQTPIGTIPLRKLFTNRAKVEDVGRLLSTEAVKKEILHIVSQENKLKPYSDQEIVQLLVEKGISISRRTVTKYREQLSILSSTKRKRYTN